MSQRSAERQLQLLELAKKKTKPLNRASEEETVRREHNQEPTGDRRHASAGTLSETPSDSIWYSKSGSDVYMCIITAKEKPAMTLHLPGSSIHTLNYIT